MRAIIFAGGVGTRMWPISRTSTPKQFEKMIGTKSTLQLTLDRLRPAFAWENIYISTGQKYISIIRRQLPKIPAKNIIGEPEMKDLGPAVGYALSVLKRSQQDGDKPVAILWSDHIMQKANLFKKVLIAGAKYIKNNPDKFLFLGHKARFANQNLGWIEVGKKISRIDGSEVYEFKSWKYRPDQKTADKFYNSKKHYWNLGYWVVKPDFVLDQYKKFAPEIYKKLQLIMKDYASPKALSTLKRIYPTMEKISFDDAILEKLECKKAVVLVADFGWSDVGTWQALKEALQKDQKDCVLKGEVFLNGECEDNIVYNYNKKQLIVGIDLKGFSVVNTGDVLMICPLSSMPKIKQVVTTFKEGKNKKYT